MISPRARRSRCARRTSGVRRSKKLPADQNQLVEVCFSRAHKHAQLNVVATPAYSTVRAKLLFCPQASLFFFTRPLSGLLLGLRLPLTLCPKLLTLAVQTFQWRNDFVLFSTFH